MEQVLPCLYVCFADGEGVDADEDLYLTPCEICEEYQCACCRRACYLQIDPDLCSHHQPRREREGE